MSDLFHELFLFIDVIMTNSVPQWLFIIMLGMLSAFAARIILPLSSLPRGLLMNIVFGVGGLILAYVFNDHYNITYVPLSWDELKETINVYSIFLIIGGPAILYLMYGGIRSIIVSIKNM